MKFLLFFLFPFIVFSQVGIGTINPDSSSQLDVVANDKGVLIPRMTILNRVAISSPAEGLLVYQTDDIEGFYYYDGSQWNRLLDRKNDVPPGSIFTFASNTVPNGFLACDGSAVSRLTYADLFSIIGITYGIGDGTTTFNLPDYRGVFLRGYDNGAGNDPNAGTRLDSGDGVTTGDNVGTKQLSSNKVHTHTTQQQTTSTSSNGNHLHSVPGFNTSSGYNGAHNHYFSRSGNTSTTGNHNHSLPLRTANLASPTGSGSFSFYTRNFGSPINVSSNSTGNHSHTFNVSGNTNSVNAHNHSFSVPTRNTQTTGIHAHNLTIPSLNVNLSSGATESRPKNISVLYCVKY